MAQMTVFSGDKNPVEFIVKTFSAGELYTIPSDKLSDGKTYRVCQALITFEGDADTVFRYRIDRDVSGAPQSNGHPVYDGNSIVLNNAIAIEKLRIYCQAAGTGPTARITLMA